MKKVQKLRNQYSHILDFYSCDENQVMILINAYNKIFRNYVKNKTKQKKIIKIV
jgi:hypothetical protein